MKYNKNILLIFTLNIITFLLIIYVTNNYAIKYEYNIYVQYSIFFWILIIFILTLYELFIILKKIKKEIKFLKYCIFNIVIIDIIIISLPIIRKYFAYNYHDSMTHMGWIRQILENGTIGKTNIYPIDHILSSNLILITELKINTVMLYIPILFFLLYVMYLLLYKNIFKNKKKYFLFMIMGLILFGKLHYNMFAPFSQALFFSIIIIYFILKNDMDNKQLIIINIFLLMMVFFHPMIILLILFSLIIKYLDNKIKNMNQNKIPFMIVINTIIFFTWSSYAYILTKSFKNMFVFIFLGKGDSVFSKGVEVITKYDIKLLDIFIYNFFNYGFISIISFVCIITLFYLWKKDKKIVINNLYIIFLLFIFLLITFSGLFFSLIAGNRVVFYTIFFSFIIITLGSKYIINNMKKLKIPIIIIILLILNVNGIFDIYYSPLKRSANLHVTYNQYNSMETFFEIKNESVYTLDMGISSYRFYDGIYGKDTNRYLNYLNVYPIDHFDYDKNDTIKISYEDNKYLVISDLGRNLYKYIYPKYINQGRHNETDFYKLENDINVNKIINTGEINIYYF